MKYCFSIIIILTLGIHPLYAQDSLIIDSPTSSSITPPDTSSQKKKPKRQHIKPPTYKTNSGKTEKPTVGLGVGMFAFYGDIERSKGESPLVSRVAYELYVTQRMTASILLNFNVVFGKLGGNERFVDGVRNTNFESTIRAASMNFIYDFGRKLPLKRTATPYLLFGIEAFEFLSKTDLYDKDDKQYFYWSDGTIRDIDENASNASDANLLKRDYSYESDVRETNLSSFGKYAERSFAIPIGLGVQFKINKFLNFRLASTMHFTFTDYIDGIVQLKDNGKPEGFLKNDFYMMNSCGLSYNFGYMKPPAVPIIEEIEIENNIDFYAIDTEDRDGDGVIDIKDECQNTPPGVIVDSVGCPLDTDNDGVPNYKDDEINSIPNAIVDLRGVEITDEMAGDIYDVYRNAIGFRDTITKKAIYGNSTPQEYTVDLGTFESGLPASELTKFLSIHDIESIHLSELSSKYVAGSFSNLNDAKKRKAELVAMGLPNAKVMVRVDAITFTDVPKNADASSMVGAQPSVLPPTLSTVETSTLIPNPEQEKGVNLTPTTIPKPGEAPTALDLAHNRLRKHKAYISQSDVIFRVQLGAYSRSLKKPIFLGVKDLIEIRTDDGLFKYATGVYTTFEDVAKRKATMIVAGYDDAFITAYRNGKRITMQEVGATVSKGKTIKEIPDNQPISSISKSSISFKVQVGLYKNTPPKEQQAIYKKIGNITSEESLTGLRRYVTGNFKNYTQAEKVRKSLAKRHPDLNDIFIVALFNGEYISVQEALEILK